ncbi:MAG: kinase [Magnetovibrio sp.]|nr:kinase [Magnetovibrio sp.]|tara:strand:- start:2166 stop:3155 length:990 start_codon:yes stop_codon:yes gene_type:complete
MIISRTPFRISLFGGGTDYPAWSSKFGGTVIGTTIDKYCYINVRVLPPFFDHNHRIVWSKIELVNEIDEIEHPAVRSILTDYGITKGMEIAYNADLPARSGLGSSSSFIVGLLNALSALNGSMISKKKLAQEAIRLEQDVMKESVGCQDQIWAAYGGINKINFRKDGSFNVSPIILTKQRKIDLHSSMMLFFTGFSRHASEIAATLIENINKKERHLHQIHSFVEDALKILQNSSSAIDDLGELLDQSWRMKRELANGVTTSNIDEIYNAGIEAGAIGGKLLGAGGGGFILFIVQPENREAVKRRLKKLIHVEFEFDTSGSKIEVFQPG